MAARKLYLVIAIISVWCICVSTCPEGTANYCLKCPHEFINLHQGCYYFSDKPATWMEGIKECAERNSKLVTIGSEEENIAIVNYMRANKEDNVAGYWTSGSDLYSPNEYMWFATGKPLTYKNWCSNQPDKSGQHCLYIWYWGNQICWDNGFCSVVDKDNNKNRVRYICEYVTF